MSITVNLPDEITADRLRQAEHAGQTPDAYAKLLRNHKGVRTERSIVSRRTHCNPSNRTRRMMVVASV